MKKKITAVLLCVALLLTLSVNVSADTTVGATQPITDAQATSVTDEITVTVGEDGDAVITESIIPIDSGISLAATAVPIGHLDSVTTTVIGGWAYQSDIPNTALDVHIYITNNSNGKQVVYSTKANGYRSDLAAAGYGNGYHAFHYNMNWKTFVPGTYTVKAYAIGTHGVNPQLTNTKTFTVRSIEGRAEIITSTYIEGWVWKPDAPNEPLDVHAYIYRSNGQVAHIATTIANHLRTDLVAAGKGNGYHGYRIYIDFDSLPEESLRVELHYVDNSGYHPAFYSGYYNNLPIHLIGMIDDYGVNFSSWATQEVINSAYDIGAPRVIKCIGATKENLIEYIHKSRFSVVYTHGSQYTLSWSKNPNSDSGSKGSLDYKEILALDVGYFLNTDCLLLMACSTASTEDSEYNNIAFSFKDKGIKTVVAFEGVISSAASNKKILTTYAAGFWAKVFVRELGKGSTVDNARKIAFSEMVKKQCDKEGIKESEIEELKITNPKLINERIYCGMDTCVILGNSNLVVQQ